MFQFKALLTVLAVTTATLAAVMNTTPPPTNKCTTGSLQCCDSTSSSTDPGIASLLGLLGINVQDIDALVGVTCSLITVVGTGGTSCSEQPICCTNNSFNGIIALRCTPINLNL